MRARITLLLGVFVVMALSNAIVPVLDLLATGTTSQGLIYSAYFLGAFLLVLPAGYLSDRIGEVPLIRAGLVLTLLSGISLYFLTSPVLVFTLRLFEGFGAGLFVASALSRVNSRPDHETLSGYFMAMLNLGLVVGLIGSGWLTEETGLQTAGVAVFTIIAVVPLATSIFMEGSRSPGLVAARESPSSIVQRLFRVLSDYFWLWFSAVVLIGITGALTAIYPEFSDLSPALLGFQIAMMNLATAIAVVLVSHAHLPPIPTLRIASILMAGAVLCSFITPWSFIAVGAIAGVVMIAQLAFLATAEIHQGVVMGLFNTASYGGMTLLPFIAGLIAETTTFLLAFVVIACSALLVSVTIGRCQCGS